MCYPSWMHTTFTTGDAIYYYVYMSFGLKNTVASFQQAMTNVLTNQIGQKLEAYMDEIVVKSMAFGSHLEHVKEAFVNL